MDKVKYLNLKIKDKEISYGDIGAKTEIDDIFVGDVVVVFYNKKMVSSVVCSDRRGGHRLIGLFGSPLQSLQPIKKIVSYENITNEILKGIGRNLTIAEREIKVFTNKELETC